MKKEDLLGITYVSIWVMVWGSIGSLIDFPLLENGVYLAGSIGQISTFFITGLISTISAVLIFPKFMKMFNKF